MITYVEHSKTFKMWFTIVEVLFFILAICSGFAFKTVDSYSYDTEFNWLLALIVYGSSFPLTAILYAVYSHLDNQEVQIQLLIQAVDTLKGQDKTPTKAPAANNGTPMENLVRSTNARQNAWTCNKCGAKNTSSDVFCKSCGEYK